MSIFGPLSVDNVFLVLAAFIASSVEMVEALTIVLALGVSRGWRSTNIGVLAAVAALAVVVLGVGQVLSITVIPINALRLVVGAVLLIFGLQWLRKAILRASGFKALHDEDAIYQRQLAEARAAGREMRAAMDWYAFTLSFKGVFLEGLEVAFIVVAFGSKPIAPGSTQNSIPLAALGAGLAIVLVGLIGVLVHRPLSKVPENTMKFAVGLLLSSFGAFWGAEGATLGVKGLADSIWPAGDVTILIILALLTAFSLGLVAMLRRQRVVRLPAAVPAH